MRVGEGGRLDALLVFCLFFRLNTIVLLAITFVSTLADISRAPLDLRRST